MLKPLNLIVSLVLTAIVGLVAGASENEDRRVRLVVRSDDMGVTHAVNQACLQSVENGIARLIEVIVPGPWFLEAAEMLRARPAIDVGIHLDLTSEWSKVKWGPVSQGVPSLVDANGHFFPMTRQREGWPPNTGFLESGWKIGEVERELRAQIELALRSLPKVTHVSAHMGTATSSPELRALVMHLAKEYGLPLEIPNLRRLRGGFGGTHTTPEEKVDKLVDILELLEPGLWLFIEHPGLDTPEMQSVGHQGYENVAIDRAGVTKAMTSPRVKRVVERRGIELLSYADLLGK